MAGITILGRTAYDRLISVWLSHGRQLLTIVP
jgi:hypothetical protein